MKQMSFLGLMMAIFFFASLSAWAEQAPRKVVDLAHSDLAILGTAPQIVSAVKAQNQKGMGIAEINAIDEEWKATPGVASFMQALMDSDCAKFLRKIQETKPFYSEIFVMDNQGANVAMTVKTSDYWQGDEVKFKNSFDGGKGTVFVDEVEFDDSSQAYLVQVSVPVMDQGMAIGAITFGIDMDQVK